MMNKVKTPTEIELMRKACKILIGLFEELKKVIKPGISTFELDKIAYDYIIKNDAKPAFLHYEGFPGSMCTSIDDIVVHGIPSKDVVLEEGQIISVDVGANYHGYYSDAARTYPVGNISEEKAKLIEVTEQSFFEGIKDIKNGSRVGDIGSKVQRFVEKHGFTVVRDLTGHGVGTHLHEDPSIPNYGYAGLGPKLQSGMTIAVEPMVNAGSWKVEFNGMWNVKTIDGKPSAHYENTILITDDGVEILTM